MGTIDHCHQFVDAVFWMLRSGTPMATVAGMPGQAADITSVCPDDGVEARTR